MLAAENSCCCSRNYTFRRLQRPLLTGAASVDFARMLNMTFTYYYVMFTVWLLKKGIGVSLIIKLTNKTLR